MLPPEPEHEVIVVDDASVGLDDLLARLEGDVKVIQMDHRAGLAKSVERAAAEAQGEVLVMLRGAPEVAHGWLAPLVQAVTSGRMAGAASATAGDPGTHLVSAYALAVPRERARSMPAVPDEHVFAALCLGLDGRAEQVQASTLVAPGTRMGAARRAPGEDPEVSIVIPTLDAANGRVQACVSAIHRATGDAPYEIVLVDNGAPPQGFTGPVNAGLRAARGRYAVVMNDDVEVLPGWWPPLRAALDAGASVTFPVTIDGAMRDDFAAWCFAVSRASLERFSVEPGEFFDPRFRVWYQDTDLLARLRAAGSPPVCVRDSQIRHGLSETVASADPELRAWISSEIERDRAEFAAKHPDAQMSRVAMG